VGLRDADHDSLARGGGDARAGRHDRRCETSIGHAPKARASAGEPHRRAIRSTSSCVTGTDEVSTRVSGRICKSGGSNHLAGPPRRLRDGGQRSTRTARPQLQEHTADYKEGSQVRIRARRRAWTGGPYGRRTRRSHEWKSAEARLCLGSRLRACWDSEAVLFYAAYCDGAVRDADGRPATRLIGRRDRARGGE